MMKNKHIPLLIAEDDPDDREMMIDAFKENSLQNDLHFMDDGEELMNYLLRKGKYSDEKKYPAPGLVLLDLNMPKKDGREALKEIRLHHYLRRIPVIVLTTSKAEEDIIETYDWGVAGFITKPTSFTEWVKVINILSQYWFSIVKLPSQKYINDEHKTYSNIICG